MLHTGVDCLAEFRAVVNDPKDGKSYQTPVSGHHANSLIGKKIGDVVDGIFVACPVSSWKLRAEATRTGSR